MKNLETNEATYLNKIQDKDASLREWLKAVDKAPVSSAEELFSYLTGIKSIIGNFHNDISFTASLIAKDYLKTRFAGLTWDAAEKAQGASGLDIDLLWNKDRIIGEIKTTVPYQKGFGANQKAAIKKDLAKLQANQASFKFMMVTSEEAYQTLKGPSFSAYIIGIEVVNLLGGDSFIGE